jgi:NAD(P)-dependent dehydrogenase (short-subunit alcohol dehydrogenase family)
MTTVWVTGAAGGIGAAVAAACTALGHRVIGIDKRPSHNVDAAVEWDLSSPATWHRAAADLAVAEPPHALVHAAGIQPIDGAGDADVSVWNEALMVNVASLDLLVAATRASLREARGAIVAVSSVHARATSAGAAVYATTKAALEGYVRAAALDLAPDIRVNALLPGAIDTEMLQQGFARWPQEAADERRGALVDATPLRRIGTVDEVAAAVLFLLDDRSSFITGTSLAIDGGVLARLGSE